MEEVLRGDDTLRKAGYRTQHSTGSRSPKWLTMEDALKMIYSGTTKHWDRDDYRTIKHGDGAGYGSTKKCMIH